MFDTDITVNKNVLQDIKHIITVIICYLLYAL